MFDVTGLVVTGTYDKGDPAAITQGIVWAARTSALANDSAALSSYTLTAGHTSLQVKAIVSEVQSAWFDVTGLTVNEHVVTPGTYKIGLNNVLFGTTASSNISSAISATVNDITVDIPAAGSTKPRTDATYVRFYSGSSMTISVPSGYDISKIVYKYGTNANDEHGVPTSTVGSIDSDKKQWTGLENEVTLSFSGKSFIDSLTVTYEAAVPSVSAKKGNSAVSSIAFGSVKQYTETEVASTPVQYVFDTIVLKGAHLTDAVSLQATTTPTGAIFGVEPSIIAIDGWNENGEKEVIVSMATGWAGNNYAGTLTISSEKETPEFEDVEITLSGTVTPRYIVDVDKYALDKEAAVVADLADFTATVNGEAVVYAESNEEVTLAATPKNGFKFDGWTFSDDTKVTVKDGEEADTDATLHIKVSADITATANFVELPCTALDAPGLDEITKTHNSATIAWNAVTNASSYLLNIIKHEGSVAVVTNAEITAPTVSYEKTGLSAHTQYDYTIMAVGAGDYCDENNPVLEGNFTTDSIPATLTLSENGVERNLSVKIDRIMALPTSVTTKVAGKALVGWSTVAVAETDTKPASNYYEAGASYTISADGVKLYAVYAKTTIDTENDPILAQTLQYDTWTYSGTTSDMSSYRLFAENAYVESAALNKSLLTSINVYAGTYGSVDNSKKKVTITDGSTIWNTCTLSTNKEGTKNEITSGTSLTGTGTLRFIAGGGNGSTTGIRISKIEIYTYAVDTSKYATSGPRLLENPTIMTAGGKYTTAQNVTINKTEGTIYYTINGADPTDASDEYTAAIALNTAGKYTIKAIAIDGDNFSEIVSATYVMNLPFASLDALMAIGTDVAEDSVTVSFSNVKITGFYQNKSNYYHGVYLNVDGPYDENIEIYYNGGESTQVPVATWEENGTLSGTLRAKWTYYTQYSNDQWELIPANGFVWTSLEYTEPTTTGFDNLESDVKTVKVLRDGQIYILRGEKVYTIQGQLVK